MMKKSSWIACTAFTCCLTGNAFGANIDDYVIKGRDFISEGATYTVNVKNGEETLKYLVSAKQDKMRIESKKDGLSSVIIKNGSDIFLYMPSTKRAARLSKKSRPKEMPTSAATMTIPDNIEEIRSIIKAGATLPSVANSPTFDANKDEIKASNPASPTISELDNTAYFTAFALGKQSKKNGYPCQMIVNSDARVDMCLTEKFGFPSYVKMGDSTLNYSKIKSANLSDDLFELPPDVLMVKARFR